MEKIKKYFKSWDSGRKLKMILAVALIVIYVFSKEIIVLAFGLFLAFQAIVGLSCPGGTCATGNNGDEKKTDFKMDELNSRKDVQ